MRDVKEMRRQTNANRVQFVNIELELALTFLSIAVNARLDAQKKAWNQRQARLAYETATRFLAGAALSHAENSEVESKLQQIKTALEKIDSRIA